MVVSNNIVNLILRIVSEIDYKDIVFVGGITDYYHFNKLKIHYDGEINDIDIAIFNINTLNQIENVLNVKANLVYSCEYYNQYYIRINNIVIDIFHCNINESYEIESVNFYEKLINIWSIDYRLAVLKRTLIKDLHERPKNRVIFKYLKKMMLYTKKINVCV